MRLPLLLSLVVLVLVPAPRVLGSLPEEGAVPVIEVTFDYGTREEFASRWRVDSGVSWFEREGNPAPGLTHDGTGSARAVWDGRRLAVNAGPRNRLLVQVDFFDPGFGTCRNVLSLSGRGYAGLLQMGLYNVPGGGSYGMRISGSRFYGNKGWISHPVPRSSGWHRFEAELDTGGIVFRLDLGTDGRTDSEVRIEGSPAPGDFTSLSIGNPTDLTVASSVADNLFVFLLPASDHP